MRFGQGVKRDTLYMQGSVTVGYKGLAGQLLARTVRQRAHRAADAGTCGATTGVWGTDTLSTGGVGMVGKNSGPFWPQPASAHNARAASTSPWREEVLCAEPRIWGEETMMGL